MRVSDRGFVEVDTATMVTSRPGVYAIGDCVNTPGLAHVAYAEAADDWAAGQGTPVVLEADDEEVAARQLYDLALDFQERERVRLWITQGAQVRECGRCDRDQFLHDFPLLSGAIATIRHNPSAQHPIYPTKAPACERQITSKRIGG